jgi:hypothetical protein
MARLIGSGLVLAIVPMALLNPLGRSAFLGYYLGVLTMWFAVVTASHWRNHRQAADGSPTVSPVE